MREQSASERLKGVDWSYQIPRPEPQVVNALLETVNYDDAVDVRLAAVDALRRLSTEAAVRSRMASALDRQDSPLVQIALIDALADSRTPEVLAAIRPCRGYKSINPAVRRTQKRHGGDAMKNAVSSHVSLFQLCVDGKLKHSETIQRTFPAPKTVGVDNITGSVHVIGYNGQQVQLTAIRTTEAETQELLDARPRNHLEDRGKRWRAADLSRWAVSRSQSALRASRDHGQSRITSSASK